MKSKILFETREYRVEEVQEVDHTIVRIIPNEKRGKVLIVPLPVLSCKPYILLSTLLAKRKLEVHLICSKPTCTLTRQLLDLIAKVLAQIRPDIVITHGVPITPDGNIQVIYLDIDPDNVIQICESEDISTMCSIVKTCLLRYVEDLKLTNTYNVNTKFKFELSTVLEVVNKVSSFSRLNESSAIHRV